ncbi:MAG: HAD family phosphatase [Candidatus Paceibacterota bacterium]|jgi:HAD superfamily hydrolase (TIGR01490 family)
MKKVAIFDIDGTIFRSSLLIEITEALIQAGIFPTRAQKLYHNAYRNWLNRKDTYHKYIRGVINAFDGNIKGVDHNAFQKIAEDVVEFHQNRVYRHTRDLVKELKKKKYYIIAISNSPKELVDAFCIAYGFDKSYGRIYEVSKKGKFTGTVLHLDLVSDKAKFLKHIIAKEELSLKDSVGVGDSEADIPFLKLVDKPICFNPNGKLYKHAQRAKWEVIVERKDVIYHLHNE